VLIQQIVNGLTIGSTYGLVALGYTLIYGVLGLINFAHGEIYMLGAFLAFTFVTMLHLPYWASLSLAIALSGVFGLVIEVVAYKPIRTATKSSQLISALAMSIVLRNSAMLLWGSKTLPFPRMVGQGVIQVSDVRFSILQIVIPVSALVLMIMLHVFIKHTWLGVSVRAVSQDLGMASMLGIESEKVIALVFSLGSSLGAVAGILVATFYSSISFDMGILVGLKSFIAAILGGIGSIYGAMLGGLLLGLAESVAAAYISPAYKDALAFGVLVIVLLIKPSGLLGISAEKGG